MTKRDKELFDFIALLHWNTEEEREEYIRTIKERLKLLKERLKKNEDTKNE